MKPTFFILGAQKAGTTSLYTYLSHHPQVYMSEVKEPVFFESDQEYQKGIRYYWQKYFYNWSGEIAVGEARANNLFLPYIPERIKSFVPKAKLIIMLRDPVERAYSAWWMQRTYFNLEKYSFKEAVRRELRLLRSDFKIEDIENEMILKALENNYNFNGYITRGQYYDQIKFYLKHFSESNLKIVLFNDFCSDTKNVVKEIFRFINVDPYFKINDIEPKFTAYDLRVWTMIRAIMKIKIHRILKRKTRDSLLSKLSKINFGKRRSELDESMTELLREHYHQYNCELAELAGLDLNKWNKRTIK